jgi:diadenosine tetraphosphate (Ap4A) HIT family hydrolase
VSKSSAFCELPPGRIVLSNQHGMVVRDAYPISPGHTLSIPRRSHRLPLHGVHLRQP